jgi:hypothetical protein
MDVPKAKTSFALSERHVTGFLAVAPRDVLLRLKTIVERRLEMEDSEEKKRGVMFAMQENNAKRNANGDGLFSDAPMPDSPMIEELVDTDSVRSRLMAHMAANPSNIPDDAGDMDMMNRQLDIMVGNPEDEITDQSVKVMYIMTDNYGDGLVEVLDEPIREKLAKRKAECKSLPNCYYPYGFGKGENLLKIKNFRRPVKNETINITISIRKWSSNDRQGYSCYSKAY